MISSLFHTLVWCLLAAILYFASDIYERGLMLNEATPWPFLGYGLWLLIAGLLWQLLIGPLVAFFRLSCSPKRSLKDQLHRAVRATRDFDEAEQGDPRRELHATLFKAERDELWSTAKGRVQVLGLLERYRELTDKSRDERELIRRYSVAAGIGVVFSRNSFLDGLILLVMQMRLVIDLAKSRGYKPSPVFNLCCLGWVLTNSLVMALTQGLIENAAETGMKYLAELVLTPEDFAAFIPGLPPNSARLATQAVFAGASVYITGRLFLDQLKREGQKLTMTSLMTLRAQCRAELFAGVRDELKARLFGMSPRAEAQE